MTKLQITKSGFVTGGTVEYELNGLSVSYNIKVSLGGLMFFLNEVSKQGVVSVPSADLLLSKNYQDGCKLSIGGLELTVLKRDQDSCLCSAVNLESGVSVQDLVLDCSRDVVDIKSANLLISQSGLSVVLRVAQ